MERRTKAIAAILLIGLVLFSSISLLSPLGADELDLYTKSLDIDGQLKDGGGQQVIVWDVDGSIKTDTVNMPYIGPVTVPSEGFLYPEFQFTVGNLKYEGVYDNITVENEIDATHTEIEHYVIFSYTFTAWIKAEADASISKGRYSAYEGKFASESPFQPNVPLSFRATVRLDIEPFSFTDAKDYGITWMQLSEIEVTENDFKDKYDPTTNVVMYASDRDVTNVGETFGSQYSANDIIGKDLPASGELVLIGTYRAGSWCLYDPAGVAALYEVVPIEPVIEVTCKMHIAGHNFYIEDEEVPDPVPPPPPPPPIPPPVRTDYLLILILSFMGVLIAVFAVPKIIKAFRSD